jgi:cysteinyl-tRNA synthetase
MSLRVYNSLSRTKEDFQPVEPGKVGMYLCGPTVYKHSHIGHMVGPVIFDTVKRYLSYVGYNVTFIINITDVDDKLINRANERGMDVDALAAEMTQDYYDNLETMGVDSVDRFPYATKHIDDMLDMIGRLVDKGMAYPADGDVYFEVTKDDDYGKLSRRNVEEMLAGTRVETAQQKRNAADFALWKKSKPGEPSWESPWGLGRPGWHIECSVMSTKYLGESFDIHGGGLDLLFPHHENELAQAESCTNKPFARYWMHNGLMQEASSPGKVGGGHDRHGDMENDKESQEANKLAGSKGAASVRELFERHDPETVRFFLLATHYRSPIEFGDERIAETGKGLESFYRLIETYERISGDDFYALTTPNNRDATTDLSVAAEFGEELAQLRDRFWEAMDDDFNTGGAIGSLFEMRKCINGFINAKQLENADVREADAIAALKASMTLVKELANILGVFRKRIEVTDGADDAFAGELMELLIELRAQARKDKNFAMADTIRDRLTDLKVTLEDRSEGTTWRRD